MSSKNETDRNREPQNKTDRNLELLTKTILNQTVGFQKFELQNQKFVTVNCRCAATDAHRGKNRPNC